MTPEVVLLILRILMAITLYAFLGILLFYLQRDVRLAKSQLLPTPQAYLEALEGEDAGLTFAMDRVNLLGRAASNTIQLKETTVSAQHARLSYQGTLWWLEDLGSRNGTRVNEIDVSQPLVVTYGDILAFGRCTMRLQAGSIPPHPGVRAATIPIEDGHIREKAKPEPPNEERDRQQPADAELHE